MPSKVIADIADLNMDEPQGDDLPGKHGDFPQLCEITRGYSG